MPARSEQLFILPCGNGQAVRIISFPSWWDRKEFFKSYSQREIDLGNPVDANFVWVLTSEEALAWNRLCAERFSASIVSMETKVMEDMGELEAVLRDARRAIVESYEWEAGLDYKNLGLA